MTFHDDAIGAAISGHDFAGVQLLDLFIGIAKSTVVIVWSLSRVKKQKSLGLSPSTFLHFDSLDRSTTINDNDTDITRENIYTLK